MPNHANIEVLRGQSDATVWRALQEGNKQALEVLFFRHYADLHRYATRFSSVGIEAEDHIQALFLKIWERRKRLGTVTAVKTYLWTALRRSLLSAQRKQRKEYKTIEERQLQQKKIQFSAEQLRINDEQLDQLNDILDKALNQLSDRQKEILYLKFFEGMSYNEIEQIMAISYQTARNYVHEALKALKIVVETQASPDIIPLSLSALLCLLLFI